MAEIVKSTTSIPSLATVRPDNADRLQGDLLAGENLGACDATRIASDGKVYKSSGAAANSNAAIHGWVGRPAKTGQPTTIYRNVVFSYPSTPAIIPGKNYFLSGTVAGGIADAASTGGLVPCAVGVDASNRLLVLGIFI